MTNHNAKVFNNIITPHLNDSSSNLINTVIINLYEILDSAGHELTIKSGGYDPQLGELLGGERRDIGAEIFKKLNTLEVVKSKLHFLKQELNKQSLPYEEEIIKDIESSLYIILNNYWNEDSLKEMSVAYLCLDLLIIQNKLLMTEIKYFERVKNIY